MATRPSEKNEQPTSNGWRPQPGDEIVGVVRDGAVADSGWGSYPVYSIQRDSTPGAKDGAGEYVDLHCFHDVLRKRVTALRPQTGERVRVRYLGTKPTADGRQTVNLYTVEVAGRGVDPIAALEAQEMRAALAGKAPAPQAAIEQVLPAQAELPPVEPGEKFGDDTPF